MTFEGGGEGEEAGAGELALCKIVYEKKKNFKPNVAKQKHLFLSGGHIRICFKVLY